MGRNQLLGHYLGWRVCLGRLLPSVRPQKPAVPVARLGRGGAAAGAGAAGGIGLGTAVAIGVVGAAVLGGIINEVGDDNNNPAAVG